MDIYVNGAYRNNKTEIGMLMQDFNAKSSDEMNFEVLAECVNYLKNEGGQGKMSRIFEEISAEAASDATAKAAVKAKDEKNNNAD
ncbi:MAG: hypothetical protein LUG24_03835 [Clostridiales bacterium]|nr:hypothetical protein [Clostridiales bacterium]